MLEMLCDAGPRNETLSRAVAEVFGVMNTCGCDVALNMIKLLLQKGAAGPPIHEALLAAIDDDRLEIVRVLVGHGADANYWNGAAFGIAIKKSNLEALRLLCARCPPSQLSIEYAFVVAIDPRYYTSEALELLLCSAQNPGTALNASWSSEMLKGNPNTTEIVLCLLRHGLDTNLRDGVVLLFAIQENNVVLFEKILSTNMNITSLRSAFRAAACVQPRVLELYTMRLLLEKANSAEIGQSESLLQQIHYALSGDFAGLSLLLRHKAVATADGFAKACLATASSKISWNEKHEIFALLFASSDGVSTKDKSNLLADFVTAFPVSTQLPGWLLASGAEVKYSTLKGALETSSLELLHLLLSSIKSVDTIVRTFTHTRKTTMVLDRKYWIYQHLLNKGIPSDDASKALLDSLKADNLGDLSLPKLLLENGASPGYKDGKAFSLALRSKSPNSLLAVRLLTQYLVDDTMATVAFDAVRKTPMVQKPIRVEIYRRLLEWNIGEPTISQALADSFKGGSPEISYLQLLLAKGADPNKYSGRCLEMASKLGALAEFRALSKYTKQQVALKVLMNNFKKEWNIVRWFKVLLEEQPQPAKIDQDELVFQCMKKFPAGTTLLKLLLDQGVSASAKIDYRLCGSWKPEPCTVLIWALFQQPRIENDVILVLLSRGDAGMLTALHISTTDIGYSTAGVFDAPDKSICSFWLPAGQSAPPYLESSAQYRQGPNIRLCDSWVLVWSPEYVTKRIRKGL
jgi:hypothetical protein